jgi:tRNA threonylcarbamoyladenosine biosynthesis protein TsaB
MIIVTIRTDNPEAEVGVFDGQTQLAYKAWHAHRQLAETLHSNLEALLATHELTWQHLAGIVIYEGPGSFTGLRIGMTVANILASDLAIPIVATRDEHWIAHGLQRLEAGDNDQIALPFYGRDAHITAPRK